HYDVRLIFDVDPKTNYSFFGVADILLDVKKPTSKIVLHAQDYTIAEDKVVFQGAGDVPVATSVKINDTYNFLTITLNKELLEGTSYRVQIPFYGNLKIGLDGVYISTYVNKKNKLREYLIATQFEAISARKGFPCFDEPIYKATFKLNIGHHEEFTAVSNMPLFNTTTVNVLEDVWPWETIAKKFKKDRAHFVWDQFENSVPMSTYLVAFVVSKFAYVESPPELANTKFRIWARSDAIDQTAYAANLGPRVLSHFERWFNVSFPLPKQDMIAIPDFSAGAMENWGLVTYRETALLYDNQQSSFLNKERVAEVIAHELAHQWFGNLVTMKWWSDLWLNEGFATFAASVGVAATEPGWRADRSYAVDNILSVLSLDALESSHPVSVPIDNPKRISEIFDEISYRKGSTIIRMMTMFLGEHVFREAINNYLVKHSYGNAEQDDLWSELTAATQRHGGLSRNVTVKQIMDTWTTQTGYPLLTVTRDYSDNSLTISQVLTGLSQPVFIYYNTLMLKLLTDYLPLSTGLRALAKIENVLKRTPDYGAFQKFVRRLIGETYTRSGGLSTGRILNEDDLISVKMQVTTSSWACRMKVPGCEENAIALFQRWMDSPNPDENNPSVHPTHYLYYLLISLTIYSVTFWAITEGSEVRRQDAAAVLTGVTRSTVGYYVARDFIYDRIEDVYNAFSQGRRIGYIIKTLLDQFTTQKELDQFLEWKQKNEKYLEDARLAVEQGVERARVNIDWLARHRRHVVDRLRDFSSYRRAADQREEQSIMLSIYAIHNLTSSRSPNYVYELGKR
ncbi:PREDICTED: aminopeptidase N-like, partial [Papilio polytes]|uniref:aminopeptidase N-like n=1 Tax=Papilio polytes TaxID=76194 RepID=UPI00067682F5